jgi:hypothetical protein
MIIDSVTVFFFGNLFIFPRTDLYIHDSINTMFQNQKNKLHFIPQFPILTEDVIFINNILYNLSRKTLKNLTHLEIGYLDLNHHDKG